MALVDLLDLHGALYGPTWTRLATTAYAGSDMLQLQVRPLAPFEGSGFVQATDTYATVLFQFTSGMVSAQPMIVCLRLDAQTACDASHTCRRV